jgi:hypothetical protein
MKISYFSKHNAFSLFELMVSMTLLIVLLVSLSTIFTAGMGIYKNHDRGLYPYKEARNVFSIIETDLAAVLASIPGGTNSELLQGNSTVCRFIAVDPVNNDTLGIRYIFDEDTQQLERQSTITDAATLPINFTNADVIGENISACTITYYGGLFSGLRLTNGDTQWPGAAPIDAPASEMPKAISVTLTIMDPLYPDIQETFTRFFIIENR